MPDETAMVLFAAQSSPEQDKIVANVGGYATL